MFFHKYPHPANFAFAGRCENGMLASSAGTFGLRLTSFSDDAHRVQIVEEKKWPRDSLVERLSENTPAGEGVGSTRLVVTEGGGMQLSAMNGEPLLAAGDGGWFATAGRSWLFRFERTPDMQFYGLGEKHTPFERSGRAYRFWNADAWADHPRESVEHGDYDPDYISIAYLIVKRGNLYTGLLYEGPHPAWVDLGGGGDAAGQPGGVGEEPASMVIGADDGPPSLWILHGPSLAELTRKLQRRSGTTPLPPLWALGYHQSRWGYRGGDDLHRLADRFAEAYFPVDGLWLDIDYMDGFRVFTFDPALLPRPEETAAAMARHNLRVVPILDPGVKREKGFPVYESGRRRDLFCRNEAGGEFVGIVWPGRTVFPDFSLPETRRWWAGLAENFFRCGFGGAWLDMNDPSTGPVDGDAMRFERGGADHGAYRNQYALLMAKATREGFSFARPDTRPFLLSRSGCLGSQKYAAHWTGDNFSSYRHLRRSVGKCLNLALSGLPFIGPDVGGFGGDGSEALLVDWVKAAFLFPFLRNHTMRESRDQEPWAFSAEALETVRHYVRLRYAFLPYLYNLFADQEETGEAILRPLFYDFEDTEALPLGAVDDQFMVGPAVMQAPFLSRSRKERRVSLPPARWLRGDTGRWVTGGRRMKETRAKGATPLFFREGSLLPFQAGTRIDNRSKLHEVGLLCCIPPGFSETSRCRYRVDDGISYGYRRGARTELEIEARLDGGTVRLRVETRRRGFGNVRLTPYTVDAHPDFLFECDGRMQEMKAVREPVRLTAETPFCWHRWESINGGP